MDVFYKPPLQHPIECEALETNYINCMLQKAIKDNVTTNKCKLESILWFHLECPKHVEKFDCPNFMKRRFKELFEDVVGAKMDQELTYKETRGFTEQSKYNLYPDDIKYMKDIEEFEDTFENPMKTIITEEFEDVSDILAKRVYDATPLRRDSTPPEHRVTYNIPDLLKGIQKHDEQWERRTEIKWKVSGDDEGGDDEGDDE